MPEATLRTYAIYYDLFDEVLSAGNVDGTDSTDELALRDVVDIETRVSLNDAMLMNGGAAGKDEPILWHTTLVPGKWEMWNAYAVLWEVENDDAGGGFVMGLDTDLANPISVMLDWSGGNINTRWSGSVLETSEDTKYQFLLVRRSDSGGYYYLFRTGDDPWKLFWIEDGPLIGT